MFLGGDFLGWMSFLAFVGALVCYDEYRQDFPDFLLSVVATFLTGVFALTAAVGLYLR